MKKPALGRELGAAIVAALGLPKSTVAIDIRIRHDELVQVECSYYPDEDAARNFATVMTRLTLTEREPDNTPKQIT